MDGREQIDEPYEKRRKILESFFSTGNLDRKKVKLVPATRVKNPSDIDDMMKESLDAGCEGLVIKDPKSPYRVAPEDTLESSSNLSTERK